jgi:hypothetical protein
MLDAIYNVFYMHVFINLSLHDIILTRFFTKRIRVHTSLKEIACELQI